MITLSIRQPWCWLITRPDLDAWDRESAYLTGEIKDIENRSWKTNYRGPFLIHASKEFDKAALTPIARGQLMDKFGIKLPPAADLQRGGIVGMAELFDCVTESDSAWYMGDIGFRIRNAKPLPFLPCPGKLGFFETDYRIAA